MEKEKAIKRQIVNAVEVVKSKIKDMRKTESDNKQVIETVFKPITDPLKKIAENKQNEFTVHDLVNYRDTKENVKNKAEKDFEHDFSGSEQESSNFEDPSDDESMRTYKSTASSDQNISSWSLNPKIFKDVPFGVRNDNGKLMMGSKPVTYSDKYIFIGKNRFDWTPGMKDLLFKKYFNFSNITNDDMKNYRSILMETNAHRRDYDPSKPIKSNKGQKYLTIIKPLFTLGKTVEPGESKSYIQNILGKGLPTMKTWKENIDFVYWDDPNELVERLKLLIASRDAGNTGLDNEIISIIEELRESNIIP